MLVFEKMAVYLHAEVQPQRKSRKFLMRALVTREIMRSRDAQCTRADDERSSNLHALKGKHQSFRFLWRQHEHKKQNWQ